MTYVFIRWKFVLLSSNDNFVIAFIQKEKKIHWISDYIYFWIMNAMESKYKAQLRWRRIINRWRIWHNRWDWLHVLLGCIEQRCNEIGRSQWCLEGHVSTVGGIEPVTREWRARTRCWNFCSLEGENLKTRALNNIWIMKGVWNFFVRYFQFLLFCWFYDFFFWEWLMTCTYLIPKKKRERLSG